jgi:hypothetical protein
MMKLSCLSMFVHSPCSVYSSIFLHDPFSCFQCTFLVHIVYKRIPRVCKYIQSFTRVGSVKAGIESGCIYQHAVCILSCDMGPNVFMYQHRNRRNLFFIVYIQVESLLTNKRAFSTRRKNGATFSLRLPTCRQKSCRLSSCRQKSRRLSSCWQKSCRLSSCRQKSRRLSSCCQNLVDFHFVNFWRKGILSTVN